MTSKALMVQDELLSAIDAAKILGLSADMVRVLAREGRLRAAAQTVRGLRLFRRADVEDLAAERAGHPCHRHVVQFYDTEDAICAVVAKFLGDALRAGAPVLVIATEGHRLEFGARLSEQGIDVAAVRASGQLAMYDANQLLAQFMVDGVPDEDLFETRVGPLVERAVAARPRGRLHIYGEMVDVLCRQGNRAAALRLEKYWNGLEKAQTCSLLCGYELGSFRNAVDGPVFEELCDQHTHVLPAETYSPGATPDDSLRGVAQLQQRARALESEVSERREVERRLREALAERERAEEVIREREEALVRQNEKLHEATRARDEFLALLGHELRNPLAPIHTALEVMRLRGTASRELDVLDRQVGYLLRLVDDVLDASRLTRGLIELQKEKVALDEVVARAIEGARPRLQQRGHQVEVDVPAQLLVEVDPDRLAQAIGNLLANGAKYSERGKPLRISARRAGAVIRLSVRDEGIGIAPDRIDHVFDSRAQQAQALDRPTGGLGLGLAIVRHLVELHGGKVAVHSEGSGKGSEFEISLPAAEPDPVVVAAAATSSTSAARTVRRVLVVDDNADLAALIGELLEHLGHEVQLAHDGPSALEAAARFQPDLALLDIGLPVMDGYELAEQLRAATGQKIQLVAISGYGQEADRRRSEKAGFSGHLVKPVSPDVLARVVASCAVAGN